MISTQEKSDSKWEKREWLFIFSFLVSLIVLNIIFIFINWFVWKNDNVTVVTTVTSILNMSICLIYWFIAMWNKLKK
ncbi:hypothetical protein HER12_000522 [Spiroplasma platyhelix PALS-1]|nr:hypothetical protein [Spiroplasma platyhelix PALS-1]UJB28860.1 hypothetical protein SPLAT_v1c00930 [Spiroplasma platyhelix PALS-1]